MTTLAKLLARKQQLLERLQVLRLPLQPGPLFERQDIFSQVRDLCAT
jgi:hypothetical protein